MFRNISMLVRFFQSFREKKKFLQTFSEWKVDVSALPTNLTKEKKLLIIRLDDIGDYLLCRNSLHLYKQSTKWKEYTIYLLGNVVWKDLFEMLDSAATDFNVWINKSEYLNDKSYRQSIWQQLRAEGYETVICPSHTRPLLLDDLCTLATGAGIRIASPNTYKFSQWNKLSDSLYTSLYPSKELIHEFLFNQKFAAWCTEVQSILTRPQIDNAAAPAPLQDYALCFIGANFKSKQWPLEKWVEFIKQVRKKYSYEIVIAGGKREVEFAKKLEEKINVLNIVNKTDLPGITSWFAGAQIVISNDTMASHLAASYARPLVIIANGNNFFRFTAYKEAGIKKIITVYPKRFLNKWKKKDHTAFLNYTAVTKDISTIPVQNVLDAFNELISDRS